MHIEQIEKHFPELSSLPREKQEDILERARYETFVTKDSNGSWARSFVASLLIGFSAGAALGFALTQLFNIEVYWITGIMGGCGGALSSFLHQKHYIQQIRPKVRELFQDREI